MEVHFPMLSHIVSVIKDLGISPKLEEVCCSETEDISSRSTEDAASVSTEEFAFYVRPFDLAKVHEFPKKFSTGAGQLKNGWEECLVHLVLPTTN